MLHHVLFASLANSGYPTTWTYYGERLAQFLPLFQLVPAHCFLSWARVPRLTALGGGSGWSGFSPGWAAFRGGQPGEGDFLLCADGKSCAPDGADPSAESEAVDALAQRIIHDVFQSTAW
jgi:hypothetical protein